MNSKLTTISYNHRFRSYSAAKKVASRQQVPSPKRTSPKPSSDEMKLSLSQSPHKPAAQYSHWK